MTIKHRASYVQGSTLSPYHIPRLLDSFWRRVILGIHSSWKGPYSLWFRVAKTDLLMEKQPTRLETSPDIAQLAEGLSDIMNPWV